jgi:raffinose/stachyose/melibiose transport system substrate-binding protein
MNMDSLPFVLGNDTADFANNGIQAAASKQVMIDRMYRQQMYKSQAAKEFLNWIVYEESGQKMLSRKCSNYPCLYK